MSDTKSTDNLFFERAGMDRGQSSPSYRTRFLAQTMANCSLSTANRKAFLSTMAA